MSDRKTAERINKLIQLAGSSNENEARNAAYLACKLMRENGIEVAVSEPESPPFVHLHDINHPSDVNTRAHVHVGINDLEDLFAEMFGEERVNTARERAERKVNGERESRYRSPQYYGEPDWHRETDGGVSTNKAPPPKPKKSRPVRTRAGAMLIDAKFRGACRDCGNRIDLGDKVWWKHGVSGCVHESCDPDTLT